MANDRGKGSAAWSRADEATLVRTLAEEKAKGNWSDHNSPKKVAWTACVLALMDSEKESGGRAKTIQPIKNRWQRLKQEFNTVKKLRAATGFRWNDQKKTFRAPADVWAAYIKTNPYAKKFRKKPFPLYASMADLVNGTRATGKDTFRPGQYAFRAGQTSAFERDRSPSPPSDSLDSYTSCSSSEDDELARMGFFEVASAMCELAYALADAIRFQFASKSRPETPKSGTDVLVRAITAVEKEGGLSDDELADVACYFLRDHDLAKAYITLTTVQARSHFLRHELETRRKNL